MGGIANGGTPGSEGFGIIHEVGEGVTKLHKGQRVIPFIAIQSTKGNGSFQKYVCIDEALVWPAPDDMFDEVAAQFVINPWTAFWMLKELQVPKGEYMIQSAAGSTLGKQMIRLAKHWGIKTINVVRRAEQRAELKALGADEVIVSSEEDVVARAKEITGGKGAWGALDAVFGSMTQKMTSSVRNGGHVIVYGVLEGFSATLSAQDFFRDVSLGGFTLYTRVLHDAKKSHACAAEVAPLVKDGIILTAETEKFDLKDFKQAMAKAEQAGVGGKILLVSP